MNESTPKVYETGESENLPIMKKDRNTPYEIHFQEYLGTLMCGGYGEAEMLCYGDVNGNDYDSPIYFVFSRTEEKHLKGKNDLLAKKCNRSLWKIRFRDENGYLNEPEIVSQKKFETLLRQTIHNLVVLMCVADGVICDFTLTKMKFQ